MCLTKPHQSGYCTWTVLFIQVFFYNIFFLLTVETSTACNSREHGTSYLIFVIVRSVNYNIMLLCSCMRYCADVMGQQWRRRRSVINNFVGRTNFDDDMIINIYILYIIIVYLYTRFKNCAGVEYNASGARVSI
jgi:hypothetical protein